MTPASAKAKGRKFQQAVAADLRAAFQLPPEDVVSRPMGSGGDDIMLSAAALRHFPFAVECKHVERLNVREAFAQVAARAGSRTPLVVFRSNRQEPLVALRWADFVTITQNAIL